MKFVSYAQNFEDVILWRSLRDVSNGFYIDVGANHPRMFSVTNAFYEKGWSGINIEPLADNFALLHSERPNDINLNCALGSKSGEIKFWSVADSGLSTAVSEEARKRKEEGHRVFARKTGVKTLKEICETLVGDRDIHFLKIDVEGFENEVLLGADFSRYRPWIVVVEATAPLTRVETHEEWEHLLLNSGYTLCYKDGLNRFYLADEKKDLHENFAFPPNVFDDFILFRESDSGELEFAKEQLAGVLHSLSWRITAPLRRIKTLFFE